MCTGNRLWIAAMNPKNQNFVYIRDDGDLGIVKGFSENMRGRCDHENVKIPYGIVCCIIDCRNHHCR